MGYDGFLNVLKPPGMTSNDVVTWVRRKLGGVKVGHAGTLDPEAAGVLPLMLGKATRLLDDLEKSKGYIAEWIPGTSTDTQDAQGAVIGRSDFRPDRTAIEAALQHFIGEVSQIPPKYSALKVSGIAAYTRTRRGETVSLAPRTVRFDEIKILGESPCGGMMLSITCGGGAYIRTLCQDLGAALGCPSHMSFLLRTHSGVFRLEDAVTIEELEDGTFTVIPMDMPLMHLPRVDIPMTWAARARCGNPIPMRLLPLDTPVRLYLDDTFAGIGTSVNQNVVFRTMLL